MLHQHDGVNKALIICSLVYINVAVLDEKSAAEADLLVFVGHADFAVSYVQAYYFFLFIILCFSYLFLLHIVMLHYLLLILSRYTSQLTRFIF